MGGVHWSFNQTTGLPITYKPSDVPPECEAAIQLFSKGRKAAGTSNIVPQPCLLFYAEMEAGGQSKK